MMIEKKKVQNSFWQKLEWYWKAVIIGGGVGFFIGIFLVITMSLMKGNDVLFIISIFLTGISMPAVYISGLFFFDQYLYPFFNFIWFGLLGIGFSFFYKKTKASKWWWIAFAGIILFLSLLIVVVSYLVVSVSMID